MDRLLSVLDGETKRSIQSVGSSGIFYATGLKTLKSDFGNPIIVAHLRMKSLFEFPLIKANDHIALRNYHQKLKITITWLRSIAYNVPIKSSKNLAEALICLPHSIYNEFYKAIRNFDLLEGDVDLTFLEKWLENRLKSFFNPIASIIAAQETKTNNPRNFYKTPTQKQVNFLNNSTSQPGDGKGNSKYKTCSLCSKLIFPMCSFTKTPLPPNLSIFRFVQISIQAL